MNNEGKITDVDNNNIEPIICVIDANEYVDKSPPLNEKKDIKDIKDIKENCKYLIGKNEIKRKI